MLIDRLKEEIERQMGKPIILRGVQSSDPEVRGRQDAYSAQC